MARLVAADLVLTAVTVLTDYTDYACPFLSFSVLLSSERFAAGELGLADCGTRLPKQDVWAIAPGNPRRFLRSIKWTKVMEGFVHGQIDMQAIDALTELKRSGASRGHLHHHLAPRAAHRHDEAGLGRGARARHDARVFFQFLERRPHDGAVIVTVHVEIDWWHVDGHDVELERRATGGGCPERHLRLSIFRPLFAVDALAQILMAFGSLPVNWPA
jgi:hypothetical protein